MSKRIYVMALMVLVVALGIQVSPVKAIIGGIGDYVWIDTNEDGIQDPGEVGIAGIAVNLYDCSMTLLATTTTDADGMYLFMFVDLTPPLPGCYVVEFIKPECYTFSPPGQAPDGVDSDPDPATGLTPVMEIHDNWLYLDADAGLIPCAPPQRGKITGGGHGEIGENGIPGGSFGFNVMWFSKDPAPKGELEYVDHDTGMNVHVHVMEYLEVWEDLPGNKPHPLKRGIFGGPCTIDGEEGYYCDVYIEDNGEPGENDVFQITLSTGYVGGSDVDPILCGNIQIHKPPR